MLGGEYMKLSKERFGTKITCNNDLSFSELKEIFRVCGEKYKTLYVPLDITMESNGYSFYIAHRQSLKEYIVKNSITIDEFVSLIYRINQLYIDCGRDFHNILFDYECIFYGVSMDDTEFVYAPQSGQREINDNRCSDMLCIVSLMINFTNDRDKDIIKDILSFISEWEDAILSNNTEFRHDSFQTVINYVNDKIQSRTSLQQGGLSAFVNRFKQITTTVLNKLADNNKYDNTEPQANIKKKSLTIKGENAFDNIIFNGDTDQIYVGRDPTWADIILGASFVSRKHAMIFCENGKWFVQDLKSLNGTFLNNKKIGEDKAVRLRHNSILHFGIEEGKLRVCLR